MMYNVSILRRGCFSHVINDITSVSRPITFHLQIPNLRDSLVRILHDFKLQIALRGSSNKIFESNRCTMFERLHDVRRKGISVTEDAVCEVS